MPQLLSNRVIIADQNGNQVEIELRDNGFAFTVTDIETRRLLEKILLELRAIRTGEPDGVN